MAILSKLNGDKTYIAAIGLAGPSLFQSSTGQFVPGVQTLPSAPATAGLRSAITGPKA